MLTQISWAIYFKVAALLIAIYYLVVGMKFYSVEIKRLIAGRRSIPRDPQVSQPEDADEELNGVQHTLFGSEIIPSFTEEAESDIAIQEAEELAPKLKEAIAIANEREMVREELIQSLKSLLARYKSLNTPIYKVAIGNLIASECEKQGNLHLSADELAMLWLK